MKKLRTKPRKTVRIYYAVKPVPMFWRCRVKNADQDVEIDGKLLHAIAGRPGVTIGCHLSYAAMDAKNKGAFPHPCILAHFTKSTAIIITKVTDGQPSHCVHYDHSYGDLVELNDKDCSKSYIKKHPEMAERTFTLRRPRHTRAFLKEPPEHTRNKQPIERRILVPRGAFKRAADAHLAPAELVNMGFA